jgi:hypothetical protein
MLKLLIVGVLYLLSAHGAAATEWWYGKLAFRYEVMVQHQPAFTCQIALMSPATLVESRGGGIADISEYGLEVDAYGVPFFRDQGTCERMMANNAAVGFATAKEVDLVGTRAVAAEAARERAAQKLDPYR